MAFDPAQFPCVGKAQLVGDQRRGGIQPRRHALRQFRAVDDETQFGIQMCRARIEIERADEHATPVGGEGLGMQRRAGTADHRTGMLVIAGLAPRGAAGLMAQFPQPDAGAQHRLAMIGVTGMHDRHIGGLQRIGDDVQLHPAPRHRDEAIHALAGRHEIPRHQMQAVLRMLQQLVDAADQQPFAWRLAQRLGRIVTDHTHRCPVERQLRTRQLGHEWQALQRLHIALRVRALLHRERFSFQRIQPCRRNRREDAIGRI